MRIKLLILTISLFAYCLFTGCATDFVSPKNPYDYGLLKKEQKGLNKNIPALEEEYYKSDTTDQRRLQIREQIVYQLMNLDDEYYRKWVSNFYGRGATFTSAAETAAPVLSAAAASQVGGAATVLSLVSSGVGALNVAVQKNFLQQSAISLLTARSDALRDSVRVRINNNMTNSLAVYPLGRALLDVQDYALAGSLPEAAETIQGDTGQAKTTAQAQMAIQPQTKATQSQTSPGPVSPANTTISVDAKQIPADGTSTAKITVQAKDASNVNETKGGNIVSLLSSLGGTVGQVTDNHDGTYSATLTSSTTKGTANISGTINGSPIGMPTTISFQ